MDAKQKLKLCEGCRNNHYNKPGNSTTGRCWSLDTAEVVMRTQVGWWHNPPYRWNPQQTLSCHHDTGRIAWVDRKDPRVVEPEKATQ